MSVPPAPGPTPLQRALGLMLGAYAAAIRRLDVDEREVLRSVLAARLARDWLVEQGELAAPENAEEPAA